MILRESHDLDGLDIKASHEKNERVGREEQKTIVSTHSLSFGAGYQLLV